MNRRCAAIAVAATLLAVSLTGCKSTAEQRALCVKHGGHITSVMERVAVWGQDSKGNLVIVRYDNQFTDKCVGAHR